MAIIEDARRNFSKQTTSLIKSEKASCAIVIHRYQNADIVKLVNVNITNDKQMSAQAQSSASGNLTTRTNLVIRQDIIRCSVTNDKSGVGGTFSVTIKKGKEFANGQNTNKDVPYLQGINTGDWITIHMKRVEEISDRDLATSDPSGGLKMLGIIESVREIEVDDPGSGQPRLEFVLTGRSFGKVFDTSIFFNPVINQAAMQTILGADFVKDSSNTVKPLSNNTPDRVIKRLVRFYLGGSGSTRSTANENWYIPQSVAQIFKSNMKNKPLSKSFIDLIDTSRVGLQKYSRNTFQSASSLPGIALIKSLPTTGTIWAVMQFLQNQASNEMYTELVPDANGKLQPGLVLRQMPFSNKSKQETNVFSANHKFKGGDVKDSAGSSKTYFTDLNRYSIVSSDIRQKNVGKSDHERINYVIVNPKILDGISLDFAFVAGSNPPSIQRYGLKVFQTQTSYVLGSSQLINDGIKSSCARIISLLQDWFFLSHNMFNGTIITDGVDGFVEVGSNLYIRDIKQLYHIEGYTHTYAISPNGPSEYTTEFRVSRGQRFDSDNNVSSFIGDSQVPNDPTTIVTSFVARGGK